MEFRRADAEGSDGTIVHRRPTRRHRRNRRIRRLLVFTFLLTAGGIFSALMSHYAGSMSSRFSSRPHPQKIDLSQDLLQLEADEMLRSAENRPVYPYSVVPGGVRDVEELKWAAAHDPVVRAHYAGFDYDHARVVRLVLERTAYVSYRIGNKVYWTRRRITLRKGETVITDGRITARTKCGNRVEEVPQQLSSIEAPPMLFDEPRIPELGPAIQTPPTLFQSALNYPHGADGPLGVFQPISWGIWVPIAPPPLPGVCGIGKKGGGGGKKGHPCGPGGQVPEPSTWLLVGSGVGLLAWKLRRGSAAA